MDLIKIYVLAEEDKMSFIFRIAFSLVCAPLELKGGDSWQGFFFVMILALPL